MGQEDDKNKDLDEEEVVEPIVSTDEVIMLAFALEYECSDEVHVLIADILEKIERGLHVGTYVGNRLAEYGRIMGWSKE